MINKEHKFNVNNDKVLYQMFNSFADELIAATKQTNSKQTHQKTFSCLYELYKNSTAREKIEYSRKLVVNTLEGNYDPVQKAVIAARLRDVISFIAEETLLKVKKERRLKADIFKLMVKHIVIKQDFFDKYMRNSDKSISSYYHNNTPALEANPRTEVTYSSINKFEKTKKIF